MNLISVIVPSYNRASLIGETIESVIDQTYSNWELIIVDDGSTDSSDTVIEEYLKMDNRIKYVRRPSGKPSGGNGARNYGFEIAKGDYVKWLDSDDLLAPQCLEKQIQVIQAENTDAVFCRSRFFKRGINDDQNILGKYWHSKFRIQGNHLENFILGKIRFSNNDGLWRASCFKTSPYHQTLRNSQEYLMIAKAFASGISISFLDEVLVWIREHDSRMGSGRSYANFAKHQRLARFFILEELKANHIKNPTVYKYLNKSIMYYLYMQLKKREYSNFFSGIHLVFKSMAISYLK